MEKGGKTRQGGIVTMGKQLFKPNRNIKKGVNSLIHFRGKARAACVRYKNLNRRSIYPQWKQTKNRTRTNASPASSVKR